MSIFKFLLTALFLFAAAQNAEGQVVPELRFEKTGGLSQNTVFFAMQDKQGFIWAATGDGLNRYDGSEVKVYKPSPTNKPGYIIGRTLRTKMLEDENDRLWLSTEAGIQYLDKKTNRFHFLSLMGDSANYFSTYTFPIARISESLWLGKVGEGIMSYHIQTKEYEFFPFPDYKKNPLNYIGDEGVFDNDSCIWSAHPSGLISFNIHTKQWKRYLENEKLIHLCQASDTLYLASVNALFVFYTKTHQWEKIIIDPAKPIRCIAKDNAGNIWLGYFDGNIRRLNKTTRALEFFGNINKEGDKKNTYPVYSLFFDQSGILWIGTDGMGLLKADLKPPSFSLFPRNKKTYFIKSIYEDENGLLWLGTYGEGLVQVNKETQKIVPQTRGIISIQTREPDNSVAFMKEDSYKNMWIGYGRHLYVKTKQSSEFKQLTLPITKTDVYGRIRLANIVEFRGAWMLTTTMGTYLVTRNPANGDFEMKLNPAFSGSFFSFISSYNKDRYAIGFEEGGLNILYEHNGEWKYEKQLFTKTGFKCAYKDSVRNLLWLGTNLGLMVIDPVTEQSRLFTEEDGLNNGFIYSIIESGGHLWLSTNGGLCDVTVTYTGDNKVKSISCKNYTQNDGLQANEFNTGAFLKGRDGTLYFGGIRGVNWFRPQDIRSNTNEPKIVITQFTVNNLPADSIISAEYIRSLDLHYRSNNLFIRFKGIEFTSANNVNYAYQLTGWDKDWIYSKSNNEVRYNNLPPGEYVFYVKAANNDGLWMKTPYSIRITIYPPFWKTWWFYLLESLFVVAVVILVTRALTSRRLKKEIEKLENQKALEEERRRISQEMHDDIGAGLTQISLISEAAKGQAKQGNQIRSELDDISVTSRQLVDNISEIIWALHPQHDKLETLLAHLREQLNKLLEYADIDYHIDFPLHVPPVELNNQQRRNILLITKEIVHNSLKHSKAGRLSVGATLVGHELTFIIADDGTGFNSNIIYKGNGLKNIRRRTEELGGKLKVESETGKGTIFTYSFRI